MAKVKQKNLGIDLYYNHKKNYVKAKPGKQRDILFLSI